MSALNREYASRFVREHLAEKFGLITDRIEGESRIIEDLAASSIDIVILLSRAEDELNIVIPDEDIISLKTVDDCIEYLTKLLDDGIALN